MNKRETIEEVIKLKHSFRRQVVQFAIERWRNLDIPLAQLKSLLVIAGKGKINSRALSVELGVTPGDVSRLIERLGEHGLITRSQNQDDRRIIWLSITDKGNELLYDIMESQTCHMTAILEYMTGEDLESLLKGLRGMIQAVDQYQDKVKTSAIKE